MNYDSMESRYLIKVYHRSNTVYKEVIMYLNMKHIQTIASVKKKKNSQLSIDVILIKSLLS